ncbi:MAG: hypothetical protein JSU90_09120 [Nitrospiraceae bacterium]|nr:MAG: hypothetical protein JSU90_09120 [Nitrospiraceae bacterium]
MMKAPYQHRNHKKSVPITVLVIRPGVLTAVLVVLLVYPFISRAEITGQCTNCHTMHNSQNGAPMVSYTYGAESTGPKEYLLRGSCLGCHAQGGASSVATVNGNTVPQVYHTDPTGDLAGGNFAYILGTKGSGASDAKGHNVIDFGNVESTLPSPPGHHDPDGIGVAITCAGIQGCHGTRKDGEGIKGAHHKNVSGKLDTANQPGNSYRFLDHIKGLEDADWEKTESVSDHNEYFGASTPPTYSGNCTICHQATGIYPSNGTISGFCGTCHRQFHVTDSIGGDTSSPFTRHPTDVVLPNSGEYSGYNGAGNPYSLLAPLARTTLPDSAGSTVNPGVDVIMCLSCHGAHATDNADMMRWNYQSGTLATALSGCTVCHTAKD